MTQISKKQINKANKLNKQSADYLQQYSTNLRESLEAEEKAKNDAVMSAARFSLGSAYTRSKNRVNSLREDIEYNENSSVIGMTEMVSEVVEGALLMDESALAEMYPTYKEDIRSMVSDFLKNGNINENIRNIQTLQLMEYVAKTLPGTREGKTLTEDELANYIASKKPVNIDKSIRDLSGDVSSHVATLMEKDQKKADEIEQEVNKAAKKTEKKEPAPKADDTETPTAEEKLPSLTVEDIVAGLNSGDITMNDVNASLKSGEIDQATYDQVMAQMGAEDDSVEETAPVDAGANPKKQIQLLPDGTMNVNIFEGLVKETPRCGLLESIAVNEAYDLLKEGKEYNSELCLAKALMYITITEALNTMGLMNVSEADYNKIIQSSGGIVVKAKKKLFEADEEAEDDDEKDDDETEDKDEKDSEDDSDEKEDDDKEESEKEDKEESKESDEKEDDTPKFNLSEAIIASQYTPFCANAGFSRNDDLAERIRKKRLMEASNQIINE